METKEWRGADDDAVWMRNNRTEIPIRLMSDRHLVKTLRYLKRKTELLQADKFFDMTARFDIKGNILGEIDNLMDKSWIQLLRIVNPAMMPSLRQLFREAAARGIYWEAKDPMFYSDMSRSPFTR